MKIFIFRFSLANCPTGINFFFLNFSKTVSFLMYKYQLMHLLKTWWRLGHKRSMRKKNIGIQEHITAQIFIKNVKSNCTWGVSILTVDILYEYSHFQSWYTEKQTKNQICKDISIIWLWNTWSLRVVLDFMARFIWCYLVTCLLNYCS